MIAKKDTPEISISPGYPVGCQERSYDENDSYRKYRVLAFTTATANIKGG